MPITCICGNNKYKTREFSRNDLKFEVIECLNCGLARTWPVPLAGQDREAFYERQDDFKERFLQIKSWEKFFRRAISVIKKYKNRGDLLEVGCNIGISVALALENGFNSYGLDMSKRAIDFGGEKLGLRRRLSRGTLAGLKNSGRKFDVISYVHVMEHIENIEAELNLAKEMLKPDGVLYIESPNFDSCWRKVLRSNWYGFCPGQHIWQFSRKSLENILKNNGFIILFSTARHCLSHSLSGDYKGFIKAVLYIVSFIFNCGDNMMVVVKKAN